MGSNKPGSTATPTSCTAFCCVPLRWRTPPNVGYDTTTPLPGARSVPLPTEYVSMKGIRAVASDRYQRIYDVARQIPYGRVATYGQIATIVGAPLTARDVGDAMAALRERHPRSPVPWQRVINAQGKVSTGARQQQLLEQEGVIFNAKGHTDLHRFGWRRGDAQRCFQSCVPEGLAIKYRLKYLYARSWR